MSCTGEITPASSKTKTLAVLAMLLIAALVFSYLWAYALSDALVAGHLMAAVEDNADPRPQQMAYAFAIITSILLAGAGLMKWTSGRQIRRIDAMNRD